MFAKKEAKIKEGLQFELSQLEEMPVVEKEKVLKALKWEGQGFDTRVHIVDPHSGMLIKFQPYRRTVSSSEGTVYFRKNESGIEERFSESGFPLDKPMIPVKEQSDKKLAKS